MNITGLSSDSLKFRVPSLRNVQLTYPYLHDGSIFSVPQVIDHYIKVTVPQVIDHYIKVTASPPIGLDSALQKPMKLSPLQKNQISYFLYTLTDTSFTKSKRFGPDGPVIFKH